MSQLGGVKPINGLDYFCLNYTVPNRNPSSIKSKKELARARALSIHFDYATGRSSAQQSLVPTSLQISPYLMVPKIPMACSVSQALSSQRRRHDRRSPSGGNRGNQSKTHPRDGLVQSSAREGMEADLPINRGE